METTKPPELKRNNERAWGGDVFSPPGKLDSSLKKNTGFIKKVRTSLNAAQCASVLRDIATLSLEKYISEVSAAVAESIVKLTKSDDVNAAVSIVSALHQRFPVSFTPPLLLALVNQVLSKDGEDAVLRLRSLLRILFELLLVGIGTLFDQCDKALLGVTGAKFYTKLGAEPILVPLVKDTMSHDIGNGFSLPIMVSFSKRYGVMLTAKNNAVDDPFRVALLQVFTIYTKKVVEVYHSLHDQVIKLTQRDLKASIRTGRILDDLQQELQAKTDLEQFFAPQVTYLCDVFGVGAPTFEDPVEEKEAEVVVKTADTKGWWDDAREKSFYTEFTPYEALSQTVGKSKVRAKYNRLTEGEKVVLFVERLGAISSEDDVDRITAELHGMIPYNKATRNKILRFFLDVRKTDTLNYYARFLKVNAAFFPELISELVEALDRGFRSLIYHGSINFKNLYFFIELVKFKLVPFHVVFHKVRKMTMDIGDHGNVDILLVFYERCGKFLLFEPEYADTTKKMLDLLQAQSKSDKLSVNEKLALRNMFLIVNSFTSQKAKDIRPEIEVAPMYDFVFQVLRRLVEAHDYTYVPDILSKINFASSKDAQEAFLAVYTKPEGLVLDRLELMAEILKRLDKKNAFLIVMVIDALTENVIRGLELNDYRQNISRIAHMKLFAALFNRKVLSFKCILDLLFKIVCFAYPNNLPVPDSMVDVDPADDYSRLNLVCTLLNSVQMRKVAKEQALEKGVKSLEGFLVFLKYYICCKKFPLPMSVRFNIDVTFANFSEISTVALEPFTDIRSAMVALQVYNSTNVQAQSLDNKIITDADSEYDSSDDSDFLEMRNESSDGDFYSADEDEKEELADEEDDEGEDDNDIEVEDEDDEEDENDEDDDDDDDDDEDEDEDDNESDSDDSDSEESDSDSDDILLDEQIEEERQSEEEKAREQKRLELAEIERREAQSMDNAIKEIINESSSNVRSNTGFKVPAPSVVLGTETAAPSGPMKFSFLSKSNRLRDVAMPTNNRFAERIAQEQEAQRANREKILSLLSME